jgi:hypothetical protein
VVVAAGIVTLELVVLVLAMVEVIHLEHQVNQPQLQEPQIVVVAVEVDAPNQIQMYKQAKQAVLA